MEIGDIIICPCTELTGLARHDCPLCGGEGIKINKVLDVEPDKGSISHDQVDKTAGPTAPKG